MLAIAGLATILTLVNLLTGQSWTLEVSLALLRAMCSGAKIVQTVLS